MLKVFLNQKEYLLMNFLELNKKKSLSLEDKFLDIYGLNLKKRTMIKQVIIIHKLG